MFRRACVTCLVLFAWLFSISVPVCLADEYEELYRANGNVCQLIEAGKFSEAKAATDKMVIEYVGQEKLPEMLYWAAERYKRFDRFEDAKQIYQQIIQNHPESPWAGKAKFCIARADVMISFMAQDYNEVDEAIDRLVLDFKGQPDLSGALYWITERFERIDKFDEAKRNYQRVINDFPDGPYTQKAKLAISRSEIKSLIASQKDEQAKAALDKFVIDFAKSPDLPEALFWITVRYERMGKAEDAKNTYQRIIEQFPYSPWAKKAKLGIQRAEVIALIESQDFDAAKVALDKYITGLALDPCLPSAGTDKADLSETFFWMAQIYKNANRSEDTNRLYQYIAENYPASPFAVRVATLIRPVGYAGQAENTEKKVLVNAEEEKKAVELYRLARGYEDSNQFALARQTYEKVIKEYPGTIKAGNAVLDIRRIDIGEQIDANDINQAEILIDKFVADFGSNSYSGECLGQVAKKYYEIAHQFKAERQQKQSQSYYAKAEGVWQRIIDNNLPGGLGEVYYYAGDCRYQQFKWDGAIQYFQKVLSDYPETENICGAQAAIGWCYDGLFYSGQAPKEAIKPLIEQAYKAVLTNYPDCYATAHVAYRLAEMSEEKGDKANAITYYRKFLERANPQDVRINTVKAKLAELERFDTLTVEGGTDK